MSLKIPAFFSRCLAIVTVDLIGETVVQTGATVDGIKILRIHAGGVDFEKDGRRWTQQVNEAPDPVWRQSE